jgi:TRAP-type uncharacterized transport system fused permease subunit
MGIPYGQVALKAILPAVLYFAGIYIAVHLEAKKLGLRGIPKEELPKLGTLLPKIYLLLPLIILVYLVATNKRTMQFSAAVAIGVTILVGLFNNLVSKITKSQDTTDNLTLARYVEPLEEAIDDLTDEMKMRQVERLRSRNGNITLNFVFNDLITNYERIADHCSNVALAMLRLEQGDFETHDYEEQLLRERRPEFEQMYSEFRKKYGVGA